MSWLAKRRERKADELSLRRAAARSAREWVNEQNAADEANWKKLVEMADAGDREGFMATWPDCQFRGWERVISLAIMCGRNSTKQKKGQK